MGSGKMAKRKVNLEWNVLFFDTSTSKFKFYNVLYGYEKNIYKEFKKGKINSLEELKDFLKLNFIGKYAYRVEYEIAAGGLFSRYPKEFVKIDVWEQIAMNLDRIVEYINWKMQLDLK